jgi:S1 RNA binding domain protein
MSKEELKGRVIKLMPYGAFIKLDEGRVGLIHISQLNGSGGESENQNLLKEGDRVIVSVIGKEKGGKLNFSFIKKLKSDLPQKNPEFSKGGFEQKMKKFLRESQETQSDQKNRMKRHRGLAA